VTTHYPSLKTLAYQNSHVRNASQEFDMEHLSPTYRLIDGIPGGSSALEIAHRLGLESAILQQARELIQREDQDLDHVFQRLQETYAHLEEERMHVDAKHQEAQRLFEEARMIREQLAMQEREDRQRYRKQWQREFSQAQRQVSHIVELFKKEKPPSRVRAVRQSLAQIDQRVKEHLPGQTGSSFIMPKAGDRVEKIPPSEVGKLHGKKRPEGKIRGEKKGK